MNTEPLSVGKVARVFGVDPKTVNRWARQGKIESFRTPGGHLRFPHSVVRQALERGHE